MKKLTQILKLFPAANFINENNKDGKKLDAASVKLVEFFPAPLLEKQIKSLGGLYFSNEQGIEILLPLEFSGQGVNADIVRLLPASLIFYGQLPAGNLVNYSGLEWGNQVLFLTPGNTVAEYILGIEKMNGAHCHKGTTVSKNDLVHHLPANASVDDLSRLTGRSASSAQHSLDLKITSGPKSINITHAGDLEKLHQVLGASVFKTIPLKFERSSNGDLLKDFPAVLITDRPLPGSIKIVASIPVSKLKLDEVMQAKYRSMNLFIVHFPAVKPTISLTIHTAFDEDSKLFLNEREITDRLITNHPSIPHYKTIKAEIANADIFINKPSRVIIQKGINKSMVRIDPITTYHPPSNTSTIKIYK